MPSIRDLFDLSGRVAIVTGGSRGLGEEMAEGLAEAGAALMLCARRQEWLTPTVDKFRHAGFRVEGVLADVAKPADVQAVVDATVKAYGQVDILINNAGVTWGATSRRHAARQVAEGRRRQPHGRISVFAGGRPRNVEARVRSHHQRRVDCRVELRRCAVRTTPATPRRRRD